MIIDFNLYLTFNVFIQNAVNSVRDDQDFSFHFFLTEHSMSWLDEKVSKESFCFICTVYRLIKRILYKRGSRGVAHCDGV